MDTRCDLSDVTYYERDGIQIGQTFAMGHPQEKNDCSVIALAVSADLPYGLCHDLLGLWGRRHGGCTPRWSDFMQRGPFKWRRCIVPGAIRTRPVTIKKFIELHPIGKYQILMRPSSFYC